MSHHDELLAVDSESDYAWVDPLFIDFVEQLNYYCMFTVSDKSKLKMWKFKNGVSKLISQVPCSGGLLDNTIFFIPNRHKELVVMVAGNNSNKVEMFKI